MDSEQPYPDALEQAKLSSTAQLLFKSARLWNAWAIERVRQKTGVTQLRASHMALFAHIDLAGTRSTVIAQKLGVSKQAVGSLIDDLEAMHMVERVPDPKDGRARLVRFSAAGRAGLLEGLDLLKTTEAELALQLGTGHMEALRAALLGLLPLLERLTAGLEET